MQNGQGSKFVSNLQDLVPERFCSCSSCLVSHLSWGNNKLIFTEEINAKAPNVNCAVIIAVVKMGEKWIVHRQRQFFCDTEPSSALKTPCGLPTPIRTRWPRGPNLPLHDFCFCLGFAVKSNSICNRLPNWPVISCEVITSESILLDWHTKSIGFLPAVQQGNVPFPLPTLTIW